VGLAPFEYSGIPAPAARVRAELYPFALAGAGGPLSKLGAAVVFERVVYINSNVEGSAIDIETTHQRLGLGVHYRIDLGSSPRSPAISVGFGYDQLTFALDRQQLMDDVIDFDLPDVDYLAFYPTVAMRLPLGRRLAIFAHGAYMFISDAGAIENEDAYGSASASGFEGEAGVQMWITSRLQLRLGAQYRQIGFTFDGEGVLRDRNGDGQNDVVGATDLYYGGYLTAGFQF
ncbi:MAG: hypothetical protein AAGC55_27770, partial [Myxococcota bacterium]